MYEIIFKVPKGVHGLSPDEVFMKVKKMNPRVGEIYLENDYCLYFGLRQENDDISAFEGSTSSRISESNEEYSVTIRIDSPRRSRPQQEPCPGIHEIEVTAIPVDIAKGFPFMRRERKTARIIV